MTQPDPEKPRIIDYSKPEPSTIGRDIGVVIGGILLGAFVVTMAGCGMAGLVDYPQIHPPTTQPIRRPLVAALIFFSLGIVGLIGGVLNVQRRRWFLLGCCLGAGIMSLVEGMCFGGIG